MIAIDFEAIKKVITEYISSIDLELVVFLRERNDLLGFFGILLVIVIIASLFVTLATEERNFLNFLLNFLIMIIIAVSILGFFHLQKERNDVGDSERKSKYINLKEISKDGYLIVEEGEDGTLVLQRLKNK